MKQEVHIILKASKEVVNRNRTHNTIAKRKRTEGQTMIYISLHRKPKLEQYEPTKKMVFRKGRHLQWKHCSSMVLPLASTWIHYGFSWWGTSCHLLSCVPNVASVSELFHSRLSLRFLLLLL